MRTFTLFLRKLVIGIIILGIIVCIAMIGVSFDNRRPNLSIDEIREMYPHSNAESLFASYNYSNRTATLMLVLGLIVLVPLSICLFLAILWYKKCPRCKKRGAMLKGDFDFLEQNSYSTQKDTGHTERAYDGKITERHYSDVEVHSRAVYEILYTCKFCGFQESRRKRGKY